MQRKLTWFLVTAAVALFALIFFFERKIPGSAERNQPKRLLPIANVDAIDAIQVTLHGSGVVRAAKSTDRWQLTSPAYPARQIALENFATNLVELRILDRIPATEIKLQGAKSFGLEPPAAVVEVEFSTNSFRMEIGGVAPLTSNVYVRLPRTGEVILTDAALLRFLPENTNDWRSPSLVQIPSGARVDHVQIRAGQRSFELARIATNDTWQISKPVPARADQERVLDLLRRLRNAEVTRFVTDAPNADLERFSLQNPEVEVAFSAGTNRLYTLQFGGSPTNQTNQVFSRLFGQTNVVLTSRDLADYLKQPYKRFHDPRLVLVQPAALDRIIVQSVERFTIQKRGRDSWVIDDPLKTPVDRELLMRFASRVGELQILDIVKEVPADSDLKALGFIPPAAAYSFFQKFTNASGITTNILFTDLAFGASQNDKIFARRSDETPIYLTQLPLVLSFPKRAFELRDRKIWRFEPASVLSVTLTDGIITNALTRSATGWSRDPIVNAAAEEMVFRLAHLTAQEWVDKGRTRLPTFGFGDTSLTLEVRLRTPTDSETLSLRFGRQTLSHDAYAAIVFPGETEPTIFEFPGDLYMMVLQALLNNR